jgi:acylglycerol lipase
MSKSAQDSSLPLSRPLLSDQRRVRTTMRLDDGYETGVYVYLPSKQAVRRDPVVYLHGIQSHPGWFTGSASALAAAGHPVFQPVRRGSGEDMGSRGDAKSARQLLDDVDTAFHFAMGKSGADRVHLVGVSWGGKVAAAFAVARGEEHDIASLTMVAPGIAPHVDASLPTKLGIAGCLLIHPRKLFNIPLNDVKLFTDNAAMREYLEADTFRLHRATARFLFASRRLDSMIKHAPDGCLRRLPTTLLLGTRDRIIDNVRTRRIFGHLTDARGTTEEPDAAHTLEFEPNPRRYFELLCDAVARGEK